MPLMARRKTIPIRREAKKRTARTSKLETKIDKLGEQLNLRVDQLATETRHLGALLEATNAKVDVLAEGQAGLQRQINCIDEKIDDFREEVDFKFGAVFERFAEVDKKLDQKLDRSEFDNHLNVFHLRPA